MKRNASDLSVFQAYGFLGGHVFRRFFLLCEAVSVE